MDLQEILQQLDIESFFQAQGVVLGKKNKSGYVADCPFCMDPKHFTFNSEGLWQCYKCGETGNAITLYAKLNNCSNGEAVKAIKKFIGLSDEDKPEIKKSPRGKKAINRGVNESAYINTQGGNFKPKNGKKTTQGSDNLEDDIPLPEYPGAESIEPIEIPITTQIYTRFVELLPLTPSDREHFHTVRGFTDAIIDQFRFRSGGSHVNEAVKTLRQEFDSADIVSSGILCEANGTLVVNEQLLGDRLVIPYLDEHGQVYHLRPHKLGFAGIPCQVYCRAALKSRPEHVILTEGEFKKVALCQWGIPALAIPGISSFGDKHFDRLVYLLREFGVKKVTVIFDSEEKGNPAYKNFKEKVEDRYDTQFWSYMMGYKLSREGFGANVGWLPESWRINGKIDFDGALAAGHTKEEILKVIREAKTPKDFLSALDQEAQRIVRRKIARHFNRGNMKREFNRYVVTRTQASGNIIEDVISNFVINIKSSFFTPDGVIRNVEFVNEYGETSDTFPMDPSDMAGLDSFKKFCFSKGNYIYKGRADDLVSIWQFEFLRDSGELIYMPDKIGRINNKLWLFGNVAIQDGQVYRPDNDGIFWIDGKGYKPQSLELNSSGSMVEDAIPALYEQKVDFKEIANNLLFGIGGYEAYVALGWVIASIFAEDIFEEYKCFPILFPHGKRESGKSTLMRWLMNCFGVETEGYGLADTTQNFIVRSLGYFSSLGVWFDEYRNEPKITQKDGYLRSAYNRQISGKGTKTAFQAKGFTVHGTMAVSGEEMPRDNGLFTRCVPLQVSANKRNREYFDLINRSCHKFSGIAYELILNYEDYKKKIMANIKELKMALIGCGISDRTAENWAICAGTFDAVVLQDNDFIQWVEKTCQELKLTGEDEHMLNQFWSDVNVMLACGDLNNSYFAVDENKLWIWLKGVMDHWKIYYKKKYNREPFDDVSLLNYLKDEPYYLESGQKKIMKANRHCHVIDIEAAPDAIKEIVECLETVFV